MRILPLAIVCLILIFSWYTFITTEYFPTARHKVATGLVIVNLLLFFFSYRYAILCTGAILLLGTFNLLAFFPSILSLHFYAGSRGNMVSGPSIQGFPFCLLIVYVIVNFSYITDLFKDKSPQG